MVGCMSAGEVVRLTRLGPVRAWTAAERGPLALLKRLRGAKRQGGGAAAGAQQLAMLRRLPRILRFIPGTAQDLRAYFLTLQYWLAGSDENVANLVRFLVDRYADGARRAPARHAERRPAGRVPRGRRLPPAPAGPARRAGREAARRSPAKPAARSGCC